MWDPVVLEAIQGKLDGGVEANREQLRSIDVLTINHARSLEGVEMCENLRILVLAGCELASLGKISGLGSLGMLMISDSVIASIEGMGGLNVHTVHAERSEVLDLSPLLRCSGLVDVQLGGTALSEDSYRRVIPGLEEGGCDVTPPDDTERELTSKLREWGLRVNCYRQGNAYRICRPGLMLTGTPEVNHPKVDPDGLKEMVNSDPERVHALFSRPL
ncbi:hypothetical protein [Streptomyces laurentii]|uniref:hypothetical protein n=1 Tax=Streptomyces laurentii TaxID=39478 RepID=UPI00369F2172